MANPPISPTQSASCLLGARTNPRRTDCSLSPHQRHVRWLGDYNITV